MKRRNIVAVLGLSIITLGIYSLYWLYATRKELIAFSPNKKAIPKVIILFAPILVFVVLVLVNLVMALLIATNATVMSSLGIALVLLGMVGIIGGLVISFWWFYRYCKTLHDVTKGEDTMLFYILWIATIFFGVVPVWSMIVQNTLNKFIDNNYQPLHPNSNGGTAQTPQHNHPYQG